MSGEVREAVRALVVELLARRGHEPVADDAPLLTSGLLESTDVLELVTLLEGFGVDFATRPFDPADFESVVQIVALCP